MNGPAVTTPESDTQSLATAQEQAWVVQALEGDLVAFNAIVERYQRMAYNLALRMLRDPSLAEDVTQESFFSAYRNLSRFRGGNLKSWLLTIVANRARDLLRSPGRTRTSSLDEALESSDSGGHWADPDDQPDEQAIRAETSQLVRSAIDQLLRNMSIDTVVMTGMATDMCVETTSRDAADRGYNVVVVEDATATFVEEHHLAALSSLARVFAQIWDTERVMAALKDAIPNGSDHD